MEIVRKIKTQLLIIFSVYTVTISCFPVLTNLIVSVGGDEVNDSGTWEKDFFVPTCCFLAFAFGDLLGRAVLYLLLPDHPISPMSALLIALLLALQDLALQRRDLRLEVRARRAGCSHRPGGPCGAAMRPLKPRRAISALYGGPQTGSASAILRRLDFRNLCIARGLEAGRRCVGGSFMQGWGCLGGNFKAGRGDSGGNFMQG